MSRVVVKHKQSTCYVTNEKIYVTSLFTELYYGCVYFHQTYQQMLLYSRTALCFDVVLPAHAAASTAKRPYYKTQSYI